MRPDHSQEPVVHGNELLQTLQPAHAGGQRNNDVSAEGKLLQTAETAEGAGCGSALVAMGYLLGQRGEPVAIQHERCQLL